ncbi:urotensin-2 receptor-like protein [Anopheles sinensis]|uniref:Urotensin-2 receptor-like protein n=1 Tax=Anopheles sinensis TaxID=74873 RepID=A0A084W4S4_ANOSI|nr:urotensin-2 receptor-like protein [Anopheles sinensis]
MASGRGSLLSVGLRQVFDAHCYHYAFFFRLACPNVTTNYANFTVTLVWFDNFSYHPALLWVAASFTAVARFVETELAPVSTGEGSLGVPSPSAKSSKAGIIYEEEKRNHKCEKVHFTSLTTPEQSDR